MNRHYILDGKTPVPADLYTWGRWFEDMSNRRVAESYVGDVRISTVFLGLDHSPGFGPPELFETMVFGGPLDDETVRYSTWEAALDGHAAMLAKVNAHNGADDHGK
jgi:hypothetical protein